MDRKYSNLFWHEGVKVFDDRMLKTEQGRARIAHLGNDVTRALLNLIEHCGQRALGEFLEIC